MLVRLVFGRDTDPVLEVVFTSASDRELADRMRGFTSADLNELRDQIKADVRIAVGLHGS